MSEPQKEFEEVSKTWAGEKYGIPRKDIRSVVFELENEVEWVDTFGNEDRTTFVDVYISFNDQRRAERHQVGKWQFDELLKELINTAVREGS